MTDVTQVLAQIEQGDPAAADRLLPLVYKELRKLAAQRLSSERPGQTLQATALVHDAYLRLVDTERVQHWNGRGHFFAAAAEAMRRILIENARKKGRVKHGGKLRRIDLDDADLVSQSSPEQLLHLDEAISKLSQHDEIASRLVEIRYFSGLSISQAAAILNIDPSTAYRHWKYARAWLYRELVGPEN